MDNSGQEDDMYKVMGDKEGADFIFAWYAQLALSTIQSRLYNLVLQNHIFVFFLYLEILSLFRMLQAVFHVNKEK